MRDVTQSAQEDAKRVRPDREVNGPYEAVHWMGQWSAEEPLVTPERVAQAAARAAREAPARTSALEAAQKAARRRNLAVAGGAVATGVALIVAALSGAGQPDIIPRPEAGPGSTASLAQRMADGPDRPSPDGEALASMSRELSEARRMIQTLDERLRTEAARHDQALAQERQRASVLLQEADAARQDLVASAAQTRQALEQERAGGVALASQLTAARQDGEALAAQLRKTAADAAQSKQADATAQGAQASEMEQQKAAALADAEAARRELAAASARQREALERERARGVALAEQLAVARQGSEALDARLQKAAGEAEKMRQAEAARTEQLAESERQKAAASAQAEAARNALAAATAQHSQALDQERARATALASQLAAGRQGGETLATQLQKAIEEAGQLRQADAVRTAQLAEREQQKTAAQAEAEVARSALAAATAQHRQVLEQERARGAALANQLAGVRQEADATAGQMRKTAGEVQQLRQADAARSAQLAQLEQQKAALVAELDGVRQAMASAAQQQGQALEQERMRAGTLASQLAAMRKDGEALAVQLRKAFRDAAEYRQIEAARNAQVAQLEQQRAAAVSEAAAARQALASSGAQQRQLLEEERARVATLTDQSSLLRQRGEELAGQLRAAQEEAARANQKTETVISELRRELQQERDRLAGRASEARVGRFGVLGPGAIETGQPAPAEAPSPPAAEPATLPQPVASVPQPAQTEAQAGPEAARLVARASVLLGQGDIGSARIVLERAAEMGSARASFMLAETYDPRILSAWGTYGTRGEVARARELYVRAQAGGIPEAKERAGALQ